MDIVPALQSLLPSLGLGFCFFDSVSQPLQITIDQSNSLG